MPRKFRLTCSRMAYFDVEVTAETAAEAERLVQAALAADVGLQEGFQPVGEPIQRIVEIQAAEAAAMGLREEAA